MEFFSLIITTANRLWLFCFTTVINTQHMVRDECQLFLIIDITLKQVGANLLAGSFIVYICCVRQTLSHIM